MQPAPQTALKPIYDLVRVIQEVLRHRPTWQLHTCPSAAYKGHGAEPYRSSVNCQIWQICRNLLNIGNFSLPKFTKSIKFYQFTRARRSDDDTAEIRVCQKNPAPGPELNSEREGGVDV